MARGWNNVVRIGFGLGILIPDFRQSHLQSWRLLDDGSQLPAALLELLGTASQLSAR